MFPQAWRQSYEEFFRLSKVGWNHGRLLEVAAVALATDARPATLLPRFREVLCQLDWIGYHETLTGCWLDLVELAAQLEPQELASRLAYSQLPLAFYSPTRLSSPEAASSYLAPDLKPLRLPKRLPPSETERLVAFQSRTLAKPDWTHECHLRVAMAVFLLLDEAGGHAMSVGIQRLNEVHQVPLTPTGGYHETLTRVWFGLVARAVKAVGLDRDSENLSLWDQALAPLQDKQLPLRYYSRERLMSWEARIGWLLPDLAEGRDWLESVDFIQ
ncbi:hypothetical protein JST97_10220 [bacterium]|nr:hypothetical protein [bacterium]